MSDQIKVSKRKSRIRTSVRIIKINKSKNSPKGSLFKRIKVMEDNELFFGSIDFSLKWTRRLN